jgi:hypothetical protein
MATVTCAASGTGDFTLTLGTTTYQCVTDSPPFVLLDQGGMTQADFDQLWPLLLLMVITSYMVRKMFA